MWIMAGAVCVAIGVVVWAIKYGPRHYSRIDGGHPDSVYGGMDSIDRGGV